MSKKANIQIQSLTRRAVEAEVHASLLEERIAAMKAPPPAPPPPPPAAVIAPPALTYRAVRDRLRSEGRLYEAADVTLQSLREGGLDAPVPPKDAA